MPASPISPPARDPTAWGLAGGHGDGSLAAAEALCRRIARRHYENFTVATRLVPARLRQDLANVYAFARWSDDLADENGEAGRRGPGATAVAGLAEWRGRLEACFAGRPDHPVFRALLATVRRADLPIEPFADLLDAFEEDARLDRAGIAVRYPSRTALLAYCHRSADPVGRIVLALEGCREPDLVAKSDAICTGLQLVNFWQDMRRDRQAGRVYLPADDMARFGVAESMLDEPRAPESLRALVADELAWARGCFDRGAALESLAPPALQPAIALFVAGGRAVAAAIERAGYDTLSCRPVVGRWTKAALAARAWWGGVMRSRGAHGGATSIPGASS